jgi:hypothetical protein
MDQVMLAGKDLCLTPTDYHQRTALLTRPCEQRCLIRRPFRLHDFTTGETRLRGEGPSTARRHLWAPSPPGRKR